MLCRECIQVFHTKNWQGQLWTWVTHKGLAAGQSVTESRAAETFAIDWVAVEVPKVRYSIKGTLCLITYYIPIFW